MSARFLVGRRLGSERCSFNLAAKPTRFWELALLQIRQPSVTRQHAIERMSEILARASGRDPAYAGADATRRIEEEETMDANWLDAFNGQHVAVLTQAGNEEKSDTGTLQRVADGWLQVV